MDKNAVLLLEYLRAAIYQPSDAHLDPDELDPDFVVLGKGLIYYAQSVIESNALAASLARGELSVALPSSANEMAGPLKSLHASLCHLTWQTQQVAKGDYRQKVDFMGEFSRSFNAMIAQLDANQKALMAEIESVRAKTRALEQIGALTSVIANSIPQPLVVFEEDSDSMLFRNGAFEAETGENPLLVGHLWDVIEENRQAIARSERVVFACHACGSARTMALDSYPVLWGETTARAFLLYDISAEQEHLQNLEREATRDAMTGVYNRSFGMRTLETWLQARRPFSLCFIDLDNLKHINDRHGHLEGDHYICCVADLLSRSAGQAVISRLGGDEFMVLYPDFEERQAREEMEAVARDVARASALKDGVYFYRISYGVVGIAAGEGCTAGEVLRRADDRMYTHKRQQREQAGLPPRGGPPGEVAELR